MKIHVLVCQGQGSINNHHKKSILQDYILKHVSCYFGSTPHCCDDCHVCFILKFEIGNSLKIIVGQNNVSQLKFKQTHVSFSLKGYVVDKVPLLDLCCPKGQNPGKDLLGLMMAKTCTDADYSTDMFDEQSPR